MSYGLKSAQKGVTNVLDTIHGRLDPNTRKTPKKGVFTYLAYTHVKAKT
jgi:hypothetical protein